MTIAENLNNGAIELKKFNIESPNLKSRMIMQYVLNKPRQYVIVNNMEEMTKNDEKRFYDSIEKLKDGMPIEYITHQKEFMKLNFYVDENVLIPRQDTEILVEEVLKICNLDLKEDNGIKQNQTDLFDKDNKNGKFKKYCNISQKINNKKILDLCTGSGAIAVSLAKYMPNAEIVALDISKKALEIAKKNAIKNNVESQITFVESDLFQNLYGEKFDIIVSNPPYIKKSVINNLDKQVQNEPHIALDGGVDGLDFYRKIIKEAPLYLNNNGYLCFEIGYDQKDDVFNLLKNENKFDEIYCKKDLSGNDRVVVAR